jgi:cytochrome c biogenesis protein CcmG, thiol:disulfide interchange protein DsbE
MTQLLSLLANPRRWRFVLVLIFIIGAGWIYLFRVPTTGNATSALRASPQVGFLAPDFTLGTSDGRQVMLSTLRGQVVLVNLWASWCPPCRAEMPAIDKVYRANQSRGLVVLAVDAANQDSESDARAFAQQLSLSFPILLDRSGSVGQRYHLRALPTSYFIDRHGVIRSVVMGGPMSEALIGSKIEDLLREAP